MPINIISNTQKCEKKKMLAKDVTKDIVFGTRCICLNGGIHSNHVAIVEHATTGNILASGINYLLCPPINKDKFTVHAEIAALNSYDSRVKEGKLERPRRGIIVTSLRFNKNKEMVDAKPCLNCLRTMRARNDVKAIFFSDKDGQIVKLKNN